MAQFRNDAELGVDYWDDYDTDIATPDTSIALATERIAANYTDVIGAKGSEELNTITGWEVQNSSIPLEGYAGPTVGSLAGAQSYPESSMTWLSDNSATTLFDLFDPDSDPGTAAMVFNRVGGGVGGTPAVGTYYQLFPIEAASREISKGRNVPSTFTVNFSLNAPLDGTYAT